MEKIQFALGHYYSTYHREGGETTGSESGQNYPKFCHLLCHLVKGTVITKIWWQCVLMILYTIILVCLHNFVEGFQMNFTLSLVPILGVVTGLLLVFRTNTSYERYAEGRKIWSTMTYHLRSLTLLVWVGVDDGDKPVDLIEKTSAVNLLVAFAYATKNYLRGDYSYDEEDMKDLISHLPKFRTPSSNKPLSTQGPSFKRKKSGANFNPDEEKVALNCVLVGQGQGQSIISENVENSELNTGDPDDAADSSGMKNGHRRPCLMTYKMAYDRVTPSNIPLEVVHYLFSYVKAVALRGQCEPNIVRNMQASVLSLIDCLSGMERILRTPMPMGYNVHLHYTVWIYLLALPYQLVGTLNYWTIPAVTIASFALLGILAIGGEIENPFGYDENDLPLGDFCRVIRREIQVIVGHPMPSVKDWVMSEDNHPMAPTSWLNAKELSQRSKNELWNILARGAQDFTDSDCNKDNNTQL